jgi:AcrR family transcriptional regulator
MTASVAERLLDATIQCLIEHGYAATTTRKVAEIAGVSQGAQQHYYPTKAALVEAALQRLMDRLLVDAADRGVQASSEFDRAVAFIDMVLELHRLPIAPAVIELLTAARTDSTLGACAASMTTAGVDALLVLAGDAIPTYAAAPGFADLVQLLFATARGTALLAEIPGADRAHPSWTAVRDHFVQVLGTLA